MGYDTKTKIYRDAGTLYEHRKLGHRDLYPVESNVGVPDWAEGWTSYKEQWSPATPPDIEEYVARECYQAYAIGLATALRNIEVFLTSDPEILLVRFFDGDEVHGIFVPITDRVCKHPDDDDDGLSEDVPRVSYDEVARRVATEEVRILLKITG